MNAMIKTGGTLCALALGLSSIMRPVQAANENPLLTAPPSTTGAAPSMVAPDTSHGSDPLSAAHANWREQMRHIEAPDKGCFHAAYPNLNWEKDECRNAPPRAHLLGRRPTDDELEVAGNQHDYVAWTSALIRGVNGTFQTSDVTSEQSVGVAEYGYKGILGPNEYTLQINTNNHMYTSACGSSSDCKVWQQFIYGTDYVYSGQAEVFIQYWLLNYGGDCPDGWTQAPGALGNDCVTNSVMEDAPDFPITYLDELTFQADASPGGNDAAFIAFGGWAWIISESDSVLDISSVWNKVEFNVFGDGGGSQAAFNTGAVILPQLSFVLAGGNTSAPTCLSDTGTTGESNNLDLIGCWSAGGSYPTYWFMEGN